jgi:hypothetical protein
MIDEEALLIHGFDTFRVDLHTETFTEPHERPYDRLALAISCHALDEVTVDFQAIDLKIAQVIQRRVPGPEIIQCNTNADVAQSAECFLHQADVAHDGALRDLELKTTR